MFQNSRLKMKPEFMIVPMIDIIFFLLVFFMMNSIETVAQKSLGVQLPQAQSATQVKQSPIILTLDKEGHILIDSKPYSIDDARSYISSYITRKIGENPNTAVLLQADKNTQHGFVVAIMDMLKTIGVKKFSIAAS